MVLAQNCSLGFSQAVGWAAAIIRSLDRGWRNHFWDGSFRGCWHVVSASLAIGRRHGSPSLSCPNMTVSLSLWASSLHELTSLVGLSERSGEESEQVKKCCSVISFLRSLLFLLYLSVRSKCPNLVPPKGRRISPHLLNGIGSKNLWLYFGTTPLSHFSSVFPCWHTHISLSASGDGQSPVVEVHFTLNCYFTV